MIPTIITTDAIPPMAITVDDAVKASGQSRSALYEDIRDGKLVARKRGTRTVILVADLKAYLEALPLLTAKAA